PGVQGNGRAGAGIVSVESMPVDGDSAFIEPAKAPEELRPVAVTLVQAWEPGSVAVRLAPTAQREQGTGGTGLDEHVTTAPAQGPKTSGETHGLTRVAHPVLGCHGAICCRLSGHA